MPLLRPSAPALDALLGDSLPVGPDGFVRVVDYMGNDAAVVQAARTSYGTGTKQVHEDRGLIRYLLRHGHWTPFEMCELKLHVRVPMDTWRQWVRHRAASINEYSTRYSEAIDSRAVTHPTAWRRQSTANKQGSAGTLRLGDGEDLTLREALLHRFGQEVYQERLAKGVAREQARKDLPLSTYTEAYWKCDLRNLLNFLYYRLDGHAQPEIREYANVVGDLVAKWVPDTYQAFEDFHLKALRLSPLEQAVVGALYQNIQIGYGAGWQDVLEREGLLNRREDGSLVPNRERAELETKLSALGFRIPWL